MTEYTFDKDILSGKVYGTRYERENPSENGVQIPPALFIILSGGGQDGRPGCFTLGNEYVQHKDEYEFNVLLDGVDTGETAKRIVKERGVVFIHGWYGRKAFSRSRRCFI